MVVWRLVSLPTSMVRPMADRMPDVTDSVKVPSGLPMATTSWPTLSAELSPIGMVGRASGADDPDDREVVGRIVGDDRAAQLRAVLERDGDLVAALHDVVVRQDRGRRHRTRSPSRRRSRAPSTARTRTARPTRRSASRRPDWPTRPRRPPHRKRRPRAGAWTSRRSRRACLRCVVAASNPVSSPTVPTEPTTADSIETASTPASHRPRNGREEVAVPLGVAMDSPAPIAEGVGPRRGGSADRGEWDEGRVGGPVGAVHDPYSSPRA